MVEYFFFDQVLLFIFFTFNHLAEASIQSNLQMRIQKAIHLKEKNTRSASNLVIVVC